jgi:putative ABC transport system permease protein
MVSGLSNQRWLDGVAQDLRYGMRALRRTPLASGVMVASIALGIGVATAVFTLADVMLFRPLPYRGADRLVVPYQTVRVRAGARQDTIPWSFARYDVIRATVRGFEDAGFATWTDGIVRAGDEDRPVRIEAITHTLLTTLSIQPQAGRLFGADEDAADAPMTVGMISDRFWRNRYGRDPAVVGGTILINATPVTVVGIMPAGFNGFTVGADVWLPFRMMARIDPSERWTERLASQTGTVIARMAPGLTAARLRQQLDAALPIVNQMASERFIAPNAERGIGVMTLAEARRHPLVKPILQLMGVAVLSLLLTVCANIASILLARGHARRGEMGVRIALGASQRRVGRQVLTESTLLGALGLPFGILLGFYFADGLASLRPVLPQNWVLLRGTDLLAGASLAPNLRVLAFSAAMAGVATLLFGIGPAVAASRVDAAKLITSSGDSHTSAPVRGRQFLVMAQVALATILLVTAGLMTRSLRELLATDLGFRAEHVVTVRLTSIDTSAAARVRREEFLTQLAAMPGVSGVATSRCVPFDIACFVTVGVRAVGEADVSERPTDVGLHFVSQHYFLAMGIPISAGRPFVAEDTTVGRTRVIISESAARRLFGAASAVGKQIVFDRADAHPMDIVGIARDVRFKSVEAAASPAMYVRSGENREAPRFSSMLFVRTSTTPAAAISAITRAVREGGVPMGASDAQPLTEIVRASTSSTRFVAMLLLGFAASAALLAGLGVYGVIAYIITQRTREFGVRLVLGADERDLLRGIVRRGATLVCGGVAAGVLVAAGATRLIASLIYGVGLFDAATYLVVAAIVTGIGLLATFIPARRIARIDPADALRA